MLPVRPIVAPAADEVQEDDVAGEFQDLPELGLSEEVFAEQPAPSDPTGEGQEPVEELAEKPLASEVEA